MTCGQGDPFALNQCTVTSLLQGEVHHPSRPLSNPRAWCTFLCHPGVAHPLAARPPGAQAVVARPGAGFAVPAQGAARPGIPFPQQPRPGVPFPQVPHVRPSVQSSMPVVSVLRRAQVTVDRVFHKACQCAPGEPGCPSALCCDARLSLPHYALCCCRALRGRCPCRAPRSSQCRRRCPCRSHACPASPGCLWLVLHRGFLQGRHRCRRNLRHSPRSQGCCCLVGRRQTLMLRRRHSPAQQI